MADEPLLPISTEHGFAAALPLPREKRPHELGLCLSGGGYRAALFHLGAMRRLDELGVLSRVETFASVSGGSIALAQLATHRRNLGADWPRAGERVLRFEEEVAQPLRAFVQQDIRTGSVLRGLDPRRWRDENAGSAALVDHYARGPGLGQLDDIESPPRFVFCATDLRFRDQWVFDTGKKRVGSSRAGYAPLSPEWTLARAVGASSCLTPAFRAMRLTLSPVAFQGGSYQGPDREALVSTIHLADGGFYDNLGIEPLWRDHRSVLVSNAAPSLSVVPPFGLVWRSLRIAVTLLEQATDVRKRWLIQGYLARDYEGAYWGIASFPSSYPAFDADAPEGYPNQLIERFISQVRIDLDVFSEGEIAVLENHGYLMAGIAARSHLPTEWLDPNAPAPDPPWPRWLDPRQAERSLAHSDETKLFPPVRLALRSLAGDV